MAEHKDLCDQLDLIITERLPSLLLPVPKTFTLPVIMSLNAGIGGTEATLCVDMLTRMYQRFAQQQGWRIEIVSRVEGGDSMGTTGLKEISMKLSPPEFGGEEDPEVFGMIQWEKGVHRVQRIPANDTQGRVQSSTVAIIVSTTPPHDDSNFADIVQVMPIYPDTPDAPLVDPKDVKTEVMRSRGAGGQVRLRSHFANLQGISNSGSTSIKLNQPSD